MIHKTLGEDSQDFGQRIHEDLRLWERICEDSRLWERICETLGEDSHEDS